MSNCTKYSKFAVNKNLNKIEDLQRMAIRDAVFLRNEGIVQLRNYWLRVGFKTPLFKFCTTHSLRFAAIKS